MSMNVTIKAILVMLMRIVPTLMVRIIAHVRKDTPEMDTHVKVNKSGLHYLKHAALHINYRPWKLARILEVCFHAPLIFPLGYLFYITYASRYRRMQQWKPWLWRKFDLYER